MELSTDEFRKNIGDIQINRDSVKCVRKPSLVMTVKCKQLIANRSADKEYSVLYKINKMVKVYLRGLANDVYHILLLTNILVETIRTHKSPPDFSITHATSRTFQKKVIASR